MLPSDGARAASAQEAELEAALFGGQDPTAGFGSERCGGGAAAGLYADEDDAAEAALAGPYGGALALWEDRTGDAGPAWCVVCPRGGGWHRPPE